MIGFVGVSLGDIRTLTPRNDSRLPVGHVVPMWLWRWQEVTDFPFWNQNYSIIADFNGHMCDKSRVDFRGYQEPGLLRMVFFFGFSSPCSLVARLKLWRGDFEIMASINSFQLEKDALEFDYRYDYQAGDPAYTFVGPSDYADRVTVSNNGRSYTPVGVGLLLRRYNVTAFVGIPRTITGQERASNTPGTLPSFTIHGARAFGLILLIISSYKFGVFWSISGKVQFNIIQIQLSLGFILGFLIWFLAMYNPHLVGSPTNSDATTFLHAVSRAVTSTMVSIMGIYFAEVASLTSAQTSGTISKLKIPAIIIIAIVWIMTLIVALIDAIDPDEFMFNFWRDTFNLTPAGVTAGSVVIDQIRLAEVGINIIVILLNCGVLIFGSVLLLKSLVSVSAQRKSMLARLIITIGATALCYLVLGLALWWSFTGGSARTNLPNYLMSDANTLQFTLTYLWSFFTAGVLLLSFRASVTKEVELSKSAGTDSTSGSSARSGSSSSGSSSAGDPVIEL